MKATSDRLTQLILGGALLILLLSPTQISVEIAPKTFVSPVDPLVWLVFLLWLVRTIRTDWKALLQFPLATAAFLAACALSLPMAQNRLSALKDLVQFGEYFVAAYVIFTMLCERPAWKRIGLFAFLAAAAVNVVWAAVQYFQAAVEPFGVSGAFGNSNVLGGYLCLTVPLFFALALRHENWQQTVCAVIILIAALLTNLSGGAFIAILVACALVAALKCRFALLGYALAIAVVMALVLPRLPRENMEVLYQSVSLCSDDGEIKARYPEWQAAAIMFLENPWFGVGLGNYQINIGMNYGMIPNVAHAAQPDSQNLYLVLASSTGVFGIATFVALLAAFIARALHTATGATDGFDQDLALGAAGCLIAFAICSLWSPLLVRGIGVPLAFVLALAAAPRMQAPH